MNWRRRGRWKGTLRLHPIRDSWKYIIKTKKLAMNMRVEEIRLTF
jgi:hypothetical protein